MWVKTSLFIKFTFHFVYLVCLCGRPSLFAEVAMAPPIEVFQLTRDFQVNILPIPSSFKRVIARVELMLFQANSDLILKNTTGGQKPYGSRMKTCQPGDNPKDRMTLELFIVYLYPPVFSNYYIIYLKGLSHDN